MAESTNSIANLERDGMVLQYQFTPTMHREMYTAISPKNPMNSAKGKNVLVTGGTRGIGRSIALSWAEAGAAAVVITGRAEKLLQEVSDEIKRVNPNAKVLAVRCEATSEEDVKHLWAQMKAEIGVIDVLVANAGLSSEMGLGFPAMGTLKPSQWWYDLDVNVRGTYLQIHEFLQQHIVNGKEASGTIVIISSIAAALDTPGMSAYSMGKLLNARMAEYLHVDHPSVRSFSFHPGAVATDNVFPALRHMFVDPPEMAGGLSLYLSTPRADFLRGTFLTVNWDVEELEKHAEEIKKDKLLNLGFINAKLGPEGHPF
ncbi:NAD(P)-binding protein [Polyplosphaeria fusca]|uniref:NAD(P)-binding protein n=1 Tax=Polyplosphaeria fusca TaxID=682080 RepID=A0A9P4QZT1_9PLEO|nr:NAD(P)-binding protein [Polyplosphaeria fusca]